MIEIIKTGVNGLDTILNGGIAFEKNVLIVLRGGRGIFKTLLGMQMMLGIRNSFMESRDKNHLMSFYSLNKSEETLNKMFGGIVVSSEVENIKKKKSHPVDKLKPCLNVVADDDATLENKIRRQILTFDSNLGRFHDNGTGRIITIKNDIRKDYDLKLDSYENTPSQSNYLPSDLRDFSKVMKDIDSLPSDKNKQQACVVVDGMSRMAEEDLKRLPLESFENELRKKARVSILILNDNENLRNLDADIIIDMRRGFDSVHNYTYHELSVVKNVKGQFAFGWHKYKPMNGLVYVYPSIHKLLSQSHSVDNTFIRAINTNARYVPSIEGREDAALEFPKEEPVKNGEMIDVLQRLISPQNAVNGHVTSIIGNHNTFKRFLVSVSILNSILSEHEVFVLLLNEKRKGMIELIDKVRNDAGISVDKAKQAYEHLFFWEVRMGCISPEELISFVMEYIDLQNEKSVDVFVIDLGTIEQCFPMISNESLFVPTLATLCREKCVNLHLVCNKHFSQRSVVCTVADNLICTQRDPQDEISKFTMLLEKNDFGPHFNSRVFRLIASQIYVENNRFNVSNVDNGKTVVFPVSIEEISTTKDYWRKTINVVEKNESPSE